MFHYRKMLQAPSIRSNGVFILLQRRWHLLCGTRPLSSSVGEDKNSASTSKKNDDDDISGDEMTPAEREARAEAYRQVHDLDFATAAKILFTVPPKRKKFGLDFHLVQLFFALMPSLAAYLVAQYARYEMRKMKAQEEEKKIKEEEQKVLLGIEDPEQKLDKVIVRLDALEGAVQEIKEERVRPPLANGSTEKDAMREKTASASGNSIPKTAEPESKCSPSSSDKLAPAAGNSVPKTGEQESKRSDTNASPGSSDKPAPAAGNSTDTNLKTGFQESKPGNAHAGAAKVLLELRKAVANLNTNPRLDKKPNEPVK